MLQNALGLVVVAQALLDIGKSSGTLAGQDDQLRLAAMQAQADAQLRAAQQQAALTQMQQTGALTQAQQQAALALQTQNQQIAGANALTTAGGLTQSQNQKSLDIQYGDFLRQHWDHATIANGADTAYLAALEAMGESRIYRMDGNPTGETEERTDIVDPVTGRPRKFAYPPQLLLVDGGMSVSPVRAMPKKQ